MFEFAFTCSSTHAECIKSVADFLLSVDVPVYCRVIVCCKQRHTFWVTCNLKNYLFLNIYPSVTSITINLNWVWLRHQFSYWVCSLFSLINLTTYEPNSESNFVVVAAKKIDFYLISQNSCQPWLRCMIQLSVNSESFHVLAAFILTMPTSDLIQTFQKRACDLHDHVPSWHWAGLLRVGVWQAHCLDLHASHVLIYR